MLPLLLGPALAGCSLGYQPLTFGFNSQASSSVSSTNTASRLGDAPIAPSSRSRRVAALDIDNDPPATRSERPTKSAPDSPSDRDFSTTRLDAESARVLINEYRRTNGLKPVTLSAELTKAAKLHARDLAKWDRISHYGSDGSNPWDRVKRSGYNARVAAENVGTGQVSFQEVLAGWKASPGHNKNLLLAEGSNIGLALVHDPKTEFKTFWTMVIASPIQ
jgi:uncharacterized protein YkwD